MKTNYAFFLFTLFFISCHGQGRQVSMDDIKEVDNVYYQNNSQQPFT